MATDLHVKGLTELQKFLDELAPKVEANVIRGALRAGANVILAEAKQSVPVKTGLLRDGLKLVTSRVRNGVAVVKITTKGKHGFVANWIEFGTKAHEIVKKFAGSLFFGGVFSDVVKHPGARPHPFMRPALDAQAGNAVVAAAEYMKKRLATKEGLDTADIDIEVET